MGEIVQVPPHGAERGRREETSVHGPGMSQTTTVSERWCCTCKEWREVRGVLGPLLGCRVCSSEWPSNLECKTWEQP